MHDQQCLDTCSCLFHPLHLSLFDSPFWFFGVSDFQTNSLICPRLGFSFPCREACIRIDSLLVHLLHCVVVSDGWDVELQPLGTRGPPCLPSIPVWRRRCALAMLAGARATLLPLSTETRGPGPGPRISSLLCRRFVFRYSSTSPIHRQLSTFICIVYIFVPINEGWLSASALRVYGFGVWVTRETPIHEVGLLFRAGDLKQFKEFSLFSLFLVGFLSLTVAVSDLVWFSLVCASLWFSTIQQASFWLMRSPHRKGLSLSTGFLWISMSGPAPCAPCQDMGRHRLPRLASIRLRTAPRLSLPDLWSRGWLSRWSTSGTWSLLELWSSDFIKEDL